MNGQINMFDWMPKAESLEWKYDEDNGFVMCRCPDCGGRLVIGRYLYENPYHYCPYCGTRLQEGRITAKRCQVYGVSPEDEKRVREDIENRRKNYGLNY